jgi:hypothetical protein
VHDTGGAGALVPGGGGKPRLVTELSEFMRLLHTQRRAHRETGEVFTITQEIRDGSFDRAAAREPVCDGVPF